MKTDPPLSWEQQLERREQRRRAAFPEETRARQRQCAVVRARMNAA